MSKPWVPHPYQERGMRLLTKNRGAALLLDPGLGKTSIALGAFEVLRLANAAATMVVIAPIRPMYDTWPAEIAKWQELEHLTCAIVHGKDKLKAAMSKADVYLINPEGLRWVADHYDSFWQDKDVLCIDESTKFKNSQSKRFKLLKGEIWRFSHRWILTGTVAPNGLEDLFGQYRLCDGGERLGTFLTHYRKKYFTPPPIGKFDWTPQWGAQKRITEQVSDISLRLRAEDYLDMPDLMRITREVRLPAEAMAQYKELEREFILELQAGMITAANAGVAGGKLRQIAGGAVYDNDGAVKEMHDAKLEALDEILEETNGHSLLIIYEYRHEVHRITNRLPVGSYRTLTGLKDSSGEAARCVEKFNRGDLPYLLAHSGSLHGLNLQSSCNHMVWYSIPWNLENYIQANGRLYRQGQTQPSVYCYHLVSTGTMDERVMAALAEKDATQEDIYEQLRGEHYDQAS